ncbi:MAG: phage scaffolding protein [Oscillospiraceae bacterium]|nr:phage scaffolding protein [Oscillospiraceae bacterium]
MKEFLTQLFGSEAVTDDVMTRFNEEIGKRFAAKADFNAKLEEIKGLNARISENDKQFEVLKKSAEASEGLKAQIETLQNENKTAKESFEKQLLETKFNSALELKLASSGAKNSKALKGLLDMEKIKFEDGQLIGFDEQLETIKKDNDYLFGSTPSSTGMSQGSGDIGDAMINAMMSAAGVKE